MVNLINMSNIYRFVLVLFFGFIFSASYSQEIDKVPYDSIFVKLEAKYNVKFFYNPQWFAGTTFSSVITKVPLPEALSLLAQTTGLSIIKANTNSYVFVPYNGSSIGGFDENNYYIVGNSLNSGSKNKVTVNGIIYDFKTHQPLSGAIIEFSSTKQKMASDAKGKFSTIVPLGEQEIKVNFPGFEENVKKIKVLSDGEINIEISEKAIMLNEIVISSDKTAINIRRTQMSVVKIAAKDIKELPNSMGAPDVLKSITLLPGIQSTGEFSSGFNVRGGSSDQNLVLIEDVPIFNSAHMFGLTSIINSDAVSDMTLIKGGIPACYGERASSILNIRLGSNNLDKIRIKAGISLLDSRLNIEMPVTKKLTVMVGGRTSYSDWILKAMPDQDLKNSSAGFYDLNALISYSFNQNNKLTLFAYKSNDNFGYAGVENLSYASTLGSIRYSHRFNDNLYTSLLAGVSYYKAQTSEKDSLTPLEAYQINNSILYKNFKWDLTWEATAKHIFNLGINAFLYSVQPGTITPYGSQSEVVENTVQNEQGLEWAAYLSDDFKLNDKLSCEIGVRYSQFSNLGPKKVWIYQANQPKSVESIIDSLTYSSGQKVATYSGIEPRISIQYNIQQNSSIRASYNRVDQYINLVSKTSIATPTDLWKLSDNYIKPLISNQVALGYFTNFVNKKYEFSVETYYKTYQNLIDYKNQSNILLNNHIETDLISANGYSYGLEVYLKKNTGNLTGWISYTYSRSFRQTSSSFAEEQVNNNNVYPDNLDRPHNLVINAGYYLNRRWRLGMTFNYNTGRPVTLPELNYTVNGTQVVYYSDRNKYRLPDYHRLDISISQFENLKVKKQWKGYWTFSILNVYGRQNPYSIFYQQEVSPYNVNESKYSLYQLLIIGYPIPVFTYNFVF